MILWTCKPFGELTGQEVYAIGHLRQEVFVIEQNCFYSDFDFLDQKCWHVMAWNQVGDLVAYARLLPKGVYYDNDMAIGRVLTSSKIRGLGIGRILMQKSIEYSWDLFGKQNIRILAQDYLLHFYKSLGFVDTGKKILEDNIPHTEMYLEVG